MRAFASMHQTEEIRRNKEQLGILEIYVYCFILFEGVAIYFTF